MWHYHGEGRECAAGVAGRGAAAVAETVAARFHCRELSACSGDQAMALHFTLEHA